QTVNTRVAEVFGSHDQVRIVKLWQTLHDLCSPRLGNLARSSSAAGVIDKPFLASPRANHLAYLLIAGRCRSLAMACK
ncbi:MAG: hypothetical protein ACC645_18670, partial [Pirellulales bacterium]